MRILLSFSSKKELLNFLKKKNRVRSLKELSKKIKISKNTLDDWFYLKDRYIPEEIIPEHIKNQLEILDEQKNNWGNIKGGKKTYEIVLKKYGKEEIRRRQLKGIMNSIKKRTSVEKPFILDLSNPLFLEFYGILLGDGWISNYKYRNKRFWLIGISGHLKLDKNFFLYCKKNIKELFKRKVFFKIRPNFNSIEINFSHKMLLKFLNKELKFPIGKKIDLEINEKILDLGFDSLRHVIRGIFDTDGCFYLDKTPAGHPYPCISIEMKAPILIKQLYDMLINQGFKVTYKEFNKHKEGQSKITLKGSKQLNKWMNKIGSSNPKHLNKINAFVAQSGIRARPS